MTQGNKAAVDSDAVNSNTSAALGSALIATHEAPLLTEAVRQIDQALFWAQQGRSDLVIVFTNMAKFMLLEGNGSGRESEYWINTTRSAIAIKLQNPRHAFDCASKALALAEVIFAQDAVQLGVARGNLGRALAFCFCYTVFYSTMMVSIDGALAVIRPQKASRTTLIG